MNSRKNSDRLARIFMERDSEESVSMQLLEYWRKMLNAATNDWTHGLFSKYCQPTFENCWLVLDGPFHTVWIENLNSVLDDNKTLTLTNDDHFKMAEYSKLLFEHDNVHNASPATVSRMGMVFLSSSVLSRDVYAQAFLNIQEDTATVFQKCFDSLYDNVLSFVRKELVAKMLILDAIYVQQTLVISDRMLAETRWTKLGCDTTVSEYYEDDTGNWQHWSKRIDELMNFSSETSSIMYQRVIESYIENRVGLSFNPPGQRKMTVFIDDINMPMVNQMSDQRTNEIVRQMVAQGDFYSLERSDEFIIVPDIQLVASMIYPGGGRNEIPNRLKCHICILNCTLLSNNSMDQIFRKIGEGYFSEARSNAEIIGAVPLLITLTKILWQNFKIKMLPPPDNFHYVFNLRDFSRICEGMLFVQSSECSAFKYLLKLWKHECSRVLADRYTSLKDLEWFNKPVVKDAQAHLGDLFEQLNYTETYFVDFLRVSSEATEEDEEVSLDALKIYEEIPGYEEVEERANKDMDQFNENIREYFLNLVFPDDCLKHLMVISRTIRMPRGNTLLVGVGGTILASYIAGYKFCQITLTKALNINASNEDFKSLLRIGGGLDKGVKFIFTDNKIKDEGFLEYINNILSSGDIANLFPKDELDEIPHARSRYNLQIALCFSPIDDKFRARSLKFPGLISGFTIDWFRKSPEDDRIAVSDDNFLKNFDIVCSDEVKVQNEDMNFHQKSVTQACVRNFIRFLRCSFKKLKSLICIKSCRK